MATCTLSLVSFTNFTISRALSVAIPCWRSTRCLAVPAGPGSGVPNWSARSGTCRRPIFSRRMSASARSLKSSAACRWMAVSSRRTSAGWFLKSKRCAISRSVCWIALSTSWRSTRQTTSKAGIFGGPSIGGGADHVNPGRGRETEERAVEGDVAALVREGDARRRTERIGDARLLDRGVGLAHHEGERADAGVLAWHQVEHPARGLVALEARLEVALDAPEAAEKVDRRTRLERLGERRLDHLLLLGLVDPERLAVADDELAVGRRVVPAHAVRLLEGDRAVRLERRAERRRLDRLAEVGCEGAGGLVAALEAGEGVPERVVRGRAGRERQREKDRQGDPHARPPSFTVSRSPRKRPADRSTPVPGPARAGIRGRTGDE